MTLEKYTAWDDIPSNLKTETQLGKMGLKPAPGQTPSAIKTGGYGPYDLYNVDTAVSKAPPSPAQLAALEKAREAQYCRECGGHTSQVGRVARYGGVCQACYKVISERKRYMKALRTAVSGRYVVIDTETTGIDQPEIVHIAIVDQHGRIILDERVKPLGDIEAGATAVHGHTAESLADCPTWADIYDRVYEQLELMAVLAYNIEFDMTALRHTCRLHGTPEPVPLIRACIMGAFAAEFGDWSDYHNDFWWKPLSTAVGYFGLENEAEHDATGDAVAAWRVLQELLKAHEVT
jgi:DNA polymerase III epsilon subunit-like protein